MTTRSSRMDVNYLLQPVTSHPTNSPKSSTSPWSDRSDSSSAVQTQSPLPQAGPPPTSLAMMHLADAAALASRAPARVPVSPTASSQSTAYSLDQHFPTPPASPPPTNFNTTTTPTTSRSHQCTMCPQSFSQKVRFLYHLYDTHLVRTFESRTILPCPKCDAAFLRNTDRSKHDLCVHQRLRPFRCDAKNCRSSFFFAKDLSKHRNTVHLRHKPFRCPLCPKAFGKREHMTSHIKRVHQKLRPFKCDVCDIRLASKYNLQGHLKTAAHAAAESLANRNANQGQYDVRAS